MENHDKILGGLIGLVLGDALGMPSSMMTEDEIQKHYGIIDSFVQPMLNHQIHDHLASGDGTDDTVLALQVVDEMIAQNGAITVEGIAYRLVEWAKEKNILGSPEIGPSTKKSISKLMNGENPLTTGFEGVTNGGAMKASVIGLLHDHEDALLKNVQLACTPSHNTQVALAGAMAVANVTRCARLGYSLDTIMNAAIKAAKYGEKQGKIIPSASVSARLELVKQLVDTSRDTSNTASQLYRVIGASMHAAESIPTAIGLFYLTQGDPNKAMHIAINKGDDADTIAALIGVMAGAYRGKNAFLERWLTSKHCPNLTGLEARANKLALIYQKSGLNSKHQV